MKKYFLASLALLGSLSYASVSQEITAPLTGFDMTLREVLAGGIDGDYNGNVIDGFERLETFTQGVDFDWVNKLHGLQGYPLSAKPIKLSVLEKKEQAFIKGLPNFPVSLEEDLFSLQVFIFFAEMFGKEQEPCYIYLTSEMKESDAKSYASQEDIKAIQQNFVEEIQRLKYASTFFSRVIEKVEFTEIIDQFSRLTDCTEGKEARAKYLRHLNVLANVLHMSWAKTILAYIYQKGLLGETQDLGEAEALYETVVQQGHVWGMGVYGEYLYNRSQILIGQKKEEEAIPLLERAVPYISASAVANNIQHCALAAKIMYGYNAMDNAYGHYQRFLERAAAIFPSLPNGQINPAWKQNIPLATAYIDALLFCALCLQLEDKEIHALNYRRQAHVMDVFLWQDTSYAEGKFREFYLKISEFLKAHETSLDSQEK
jgi:hypothetical protein